MCVEGVEVEVVEGVKVERVEGVCVVVVEGVQAEGRWSRRGGEEST